MSLLFGGRHSFAQDVGDSIVHISNLLAHEKLFLLQLRVKVLRGVPHLVLEVVPVLVLGQNPLLHTMVFGGFGRGLLEVVSLLVEFSLLGRFFMEFWLEFLGRRLGVLLGNLVIPSEEVVLGEALVLLVVFLPDSACRIWRIPSR